MLEKHESIIIPSFTFRFERDVVSLRQMHSNITKIVEIHVKKMMKICPLKVKGVIV
jgi:hypothetical protein